jgi:hypothetical protein
MHLPAETYCNDCLAVNRGRVPCVFDDGKVVAGLRETQEQLDQFRKLPEKNPDKPSWVEGFKWTVTQ